MGDLLNRGTKDRPRYYCRYVDVDGKRKQRATGATTKTDARRFLDEAEERVREGKTGAPLKREASHGRRLAQLEARARHATITVEDIARRFLGEVDDVPGYAAPKIKDIDTYRGDARSAFNVRILPTLGKRSAADVASADVERLRDALLAGAPKVAPYAAATVVQTLAVLSKVYNWARRAGFINCANPVQGVERPRTEQSVDFLSDAEVAALLGHVEDAARISVASWQGIVLSAMVATAIYAGLRKGELFGLRWTDVNLDVARIDVNRSYRALPKSGKARHVPMHPALVVILRAWKKRCPKADRKGDEQIVFPIEGRRGKLRMGIERDGLALDAMLDAAGCHAPADGKSFHMLRHTFASHFVMAGGSLFTLQRLLGHASPLMTQRYAHLAPDYLAGEVARMSFPAPSSAAVDELVEARRRRAVGSEE